MAHNASILPDFQTSSSAHSLLHVIISRRSPFKRPQIVPPQAQAMKRIVVGENVSLVPRYKFNKKVKAVKTTKEPGYGKNGNLHASQKDLIARQLFPAPPHVLRSRRATYLANVLTASVFCINDSQHFCDFTVESQEQWIALLESYKGRLHVIKSGRCPKSKYNREKRAKQSQDIADSKPNSTIVSPQRHPLANVNSHEPMLPSDDVRSVLQPVQAFRYPESMKHLPRLTPDSFRQHIRDQGPEGVFVEFVPFASLAESNPVKRYKENLERHGMADYVEWGSGWTCR
ncbi:hypothetical protein KCU91_g14052, partial [Aureobasidium melanogenum]